MAIVRIEPATFDHADDIQRYASDRAIAEMTTIPHPYPADGATTFLARVLEQRAQGASYTFAIIADDQFVGLCGIGERDEPTSAEIGYWIAKPFWGKGYATDAARLITRFGFEEKQYDTIVVRCLTHNEASKRVIEKNGYRYVGIGRDTNLHPGADLHIFEMSQDDFNRSTAEGR